MKSEFTFEENCLWEIIEYNLKNIHPAPPSTERYGEWIEVIVGIGNDEVAYVTMTKEAFEELRIRYKNEYNNLEDSI